MKNLIKKTKTERSIRNVYLVSFVLLFLCYLVILYANRRLAKETNRAENTNRVINAMDKLLARVIDGETGVRGYILTKNIQFLFPYYGSRETVDSLFKVVGNLTSGNPVQQQRLVELKKMVAKRFDIIRFNLKTFDESNRQITDTMLALQSNGKKIMDDIRSKTALFEREENRQLKERETRMERITTAITMITIISIALVSSLLLFGFFTYMNVSRERQKALKHVMQYQDQLDKRIEELDAANAELIRMRSQEKFAVTGRIARTIGHEVRNPLTNIMLATDELKEVLGRYTGEPAYLFDMINRNSSRINQLIADLLDSTKIAELNFERINVAELLDETLEDAADRIALTNIKVTKKYQVAPCQVVVDRGKIKIALLNLITNALEAMEEKGSELVVGFMTQHGDCAIFIHDNGPGMDAETIARLFEPYYTTKIGGNGLGLTNTQNIIINHKGDIVVESIKGKGSRFRIILKQDQA